MAGHAGGGAGHQGDNRASRRAPPWDGSADTRHREDRGAGMPIGVAGGGGRGRRAICAAGSRGAADGGRGAGLSRRRRGMRSVWLAVVGVCLAWCVEECVDAQAVARKQYLQEDCTMDVKACSRAMFNLRCPPHAPHITSSLDSLCVIPLSTSACCSGSLPAICDDATGRRAAGSGAGQCSPETRALASLDRFRETARSGCRGCLTRRVWRARRCAHIPRRGGSRVLG